ncbi:TPA: AAA family ATPase [Candidatus Falkowbacteria bacterium]|jgi:putative ATPase|nr:MAG: ATPase, AAA family [Candidatus Falkowbacteria bacterium GW2011_GWF2_43_32]HBA36508.1 AAA family ATPase [Candidatus Falkowbacteria bacterium]
MLKNVPLATYFRPKTLEEFVGQEKIIGPKSWLYAAVKNDQVPSLIFWGPPGSGKTTLAFIIAKETKAEFVELSATASGVKDLKVIVAKAQEGRRLNIKTILFIDEIHRWNKAQQDALLPQVENGTIVLIGATTENPSFAVNGALLSRVKVVVLEALTADDLGMIINRAARELKAKLSDEVGGLIAKFANGDGRKALNILESAVERGGKITAQSIKDIINKPNLLYDKDGEEHYNLISALHKSLRGGQADAAVYYLVRMIEAGEDPLYIARRLIRFASEDIGLANNSALLLANATYDACHKIGLPECGVNLAHCAVYLAKSSKSIAAYTAYEAAKKEVETSGNLPVPLHLRNAPTKLMKDLGYAKDYKYTPLEDDSRQEYLPDKLKGRKFL